MAEVSRRCRGGRGRDRHGRARRGRERCTESRPRRPPTRPLPCYLFYINSLVQDALKVLDEVLDPKCIIVSLIKSLKVEHGRVVPYSEVLRKALRNRPHLSRNPLLG